MDMIWDWLGSLWYRPSACPVSACAGSVTDGGGSMPARSPPFKLPARFPLVQARCRHACSVLVWFPPLGSRRCLLGSHRYRLGSRTFLVYPDQIPSTPKGSISIDLPELRLHPSNASIPLPRTLCVNPCVIPVRQLLQRVNQRIIMTG